MISYSIVQNEKLEEMCWIKRKVMCGEPHESHKKEDGIKFCISERRERICDE